MAGFAQGFQAGSGAVTRGLQLGLQRDQFELGVAQLKEQQRQAKALAEAIAKDANAAQEAVISRQQGVAVASTLPELLKQNRELRKVAIEGINEDLRRGGGKGFTPNFMKMVVSAKEEEMTPILEQVKRAMLETPTDNLDTFQSIFSDPVKTAQALTNVAATPPKELNPEQVRIARVKNEISVLQNRIANISRAAAANPLAAEGAEPTLQALQRQIETLRPQLKPRKPVTFQEGRPGGVAPVARDPVTGEVRFEGEPRPIKAGNVFNIGKGDSEVLKAFRKRFEVLDVERVNAEQQIGNLQNTLEQLANPDLETGAFQGLIAKVKNALSTLGIGDASILEGVSDAQTFIAATNKIMLSALNQATLTPVTDKDVKILFETGPQITNVRSANVRIIRSLRESAFQTTMEAAISQEQFFREADEPGAGRTFRRELLSEMSGMQRIIQFKNPNTGQNELRFFNEYARPLIDKGKDIATIVKNWKQQVALHHIGPK